MKAVRPPPASAAARRDRPGPGHSAADGRAWGALAGVAGARALAWRAMALAWSEPSAGWLAALQVGALRADLAGIADWTSRGAERVARSLELVASAARELVKGERAGQDPLQAVAAEYERLIGRAGGIVARREVDYRGAGCLDDITAAYTSYGVHLASGGLPADDLTTELEFVYHLCRREASSWAAGRVGNAKGLRYTEREFIRRHLAAWVPALAGFVRAAAGMPLYPALAACLEDMLALEVRSLLSEPPAGAAGQPAPALA